MPDLTQLLKDAAGTPPTPLNMQAVRRRAARLGHRRWRLWLAALVALVGVGVPTGTALLPTSGRPTQVETDRDQPQPEDTDTNPSPDQDSSPQPRTGSPSRAEASPVPSSAGVEASSGRSGSSPSGAPLATTSHRIAYTVGTDLYVADLDGTNKQHLVGNARSVPTWAPDGNRIAYVAEIPAADADAVYCDYDGPPFGNQCPGDPGVTVVNLDGSGKRLVTEGEHPAWSPDGNWIAFVDDGISVVRPDGTGHRRILTTAGDAAHLDWSPDGTRITFSMRSSTSTCVSNCEGHVYVVDADGSNLRQITFDEGEQLDPAWSPDGNRIAFTGILPAAGEPDSVIYTVSPDGTGLTKITDNRRGTAGRPQGRGSSPDWTPDGRIVWVQDPGDPGNVDGSDTANCYMMNADGSTPIRLFPGARPAVAPRRA